MKVVNLETIIDMQSWCKTWAPNGSSRIRAKTKTSQETQRSLQRFLEPNGKPEVVYTDNLLEFGKACEDLSWNHCTSTPHRSETNGIPERAVLRVKLSSETPPDGYMWSVERLTRRQVTSRPDHLWPELWTKLGRNAKLREKHKWSNEKPKLDNARRLRGIYFIDPVFPDSAISPPILMSCSSHTEACNIRNHRWSHRFNSHHFT